MTRVPDPLPAATEPLGEREDRGRGRIFVAAIVAVLAAAVTAHGVRSVTASSGAIPEIANFADKFEFWRSHAGEFDVLLFGTSSVFRGIDPTVFDAETARRGTSTRTFNASMPGLKFADQQTFLERYVEASAPTLGWVIVEPNTRVFLAYENVAKERVVMVHDPQNTWALLRLTWSLPGGLRKKITYSANHVLAASYWLLNSGSLARLLFDDTSVTRASDLARTAGFESIEDAYPDQIEYRRSAFSLIVRKMADGQIGSDFSAVSDERLPAVAVDRFREMGSDVERRAKLGWLIMPYFERSRKFRFRNTFADGMLPGVLFDFENPAEDPRGLNPSLFSDRTHVNAAGARHISRVLARAFAAAARNRRD